MKFLSVLFCILIFLLACNASKNAYQTDSGEKTERIKLEQVETLDLKNANSSFSKIKATYENKSLLVELKYGGGCKTHEFKAFTTGINKEVLAITLADFTLDDKCRALVSKSILIDLGKFRPSKNFNRILLNDEIEIAVN